MVPSLVKLKCEHLKEVCNHDTADFLFISLIQGDRHQRSVLNFTFRDSIKDFVNIAYWLPPKDLIIISSKFTTGDVGREISIELKPKSRFFSFQWQFIIQL